MSGPNFSFMSLEQIRAFAKWWAQNDKGKWAPTEKDRLRFMKGKP